MNRKITKIVIFGVIAIIIIAAIVGFFFMREQGPITGKIEFGKEYYLKEIRPTDRFKGATINVASYFKVNEDQKTGELYLDGLIATTDTETGITAPIQFIVTNYHESTQKTTIDFAYILYAGENGEDTKIQHLQAISTKDSIKIKSVESHSVHVISQNAEDIKSLEYQVTLLVFSKEVTAWTVKLELP